MGKNGLREAGRYRLVQASARDNHEQDKQD